MIVQVNNKEIIKVLHFVGGFSTQMDSNVESVLMPQYHIFLTR